MFEGFKWQLSLLGIIALLLVAIASIIVKVHNIVRFGSGLASTEVLRRMWSKSDQVLFQPVPSVLLLAGPAGVGLALALADFVTTILQLADFLHRRNSAVRDIIFLVCCAAGSVFSAAVYGLGGGRQALLNGVITTCLFEIVSLVEFAVFLVHHEPSHELQPIIMLVLVPVAVVAAAWWSRRHFAARDTIIVAQPGTTPWSQLAWGFLILLASRLANWAILYFAGGPGDHHDLEMHYLARVAVRISDVLLLMSCALVAIAAVNHLTMAGNYRWQWASFAAPLLLLLPVEIIGTVVMFLQNHHYRVIAMLVKDLLKFGATGLVGAIAYLFVVAKYARAALDPGADGQSELLEIDDDDDDDDESEFEV